MSAETAHATAGETEWLEADGLGGFASGTDSGIRTRRYHALLLAATTPPAGRMVLVNGLESWVTTPKGRFALSSQRYTPGVVHPDGSGRIARFTAEPWPRWEYVLEDGTRVEHELLVPRGSSQVVLCWRVKGAASGVRLEVRPLLSGRDFHALHRENGAFRFEATAAAGQIRWHPYEDVPAVLARSNGEYEHEPQWYRGFQYDEERERGLDFVEDLASPGRFTFDLSAGEAFLQLAAEGLPDERAGKRAAAVRASERRRRAALAPLERAAEQYLVRRGEGRTLIAGYPWFGDWGRDTFIALRGVCLATGRYDEAGDILRAWAGTVSEGMLPNRFPDRGGAPEYNSVDASLWFIVAVHDYLAARRSRARERRELREAVDAILAGYVRGTRHGIHLDGDGLLAAGEPGVQLTWMDAKVGDWVVTPRIGKPVEVQALWLAALRVAAGWSTQWNEIHDRAHASFERRFWNPERDCLYDVVDAGHEAGRMDAALRPNQILAVGGLPWNFLDMERARSVVDAVERHLWTPLGLRSLAPGEEGYAPRYTGGVRERDGAYHQGTVWPWLLGPFVEAWVRVRGGKREARAEARARFLGPLAAHLGEAGLGHVSEIADAGSPHTPRGCPFQAWSVGELLRLSRGVLAAGKAESAHPDGARRKVAVKKKQRVRAGGPAGAEKADV